MTTNLYSVSPEGLSASLLRHQSQCSVCSHPQRQAIEEAWVDWANTTELAERFRISRDAVYRHAHALGLFSERQKRRKRLFEKCLERLDITSFKGSDLVRILKEYTKLCDTEEAREAASLPAQEGLDLVTRQDADVPAGDRATLQETIPQDAPLGETVPVAESIDQSEAAETPLAGAEAQNLEPAVTTTLQ